MWNILVSSLDGALADLAWTVSDQDSGRSCVALCVAVFMVAVAMTGCPTAAQVRLDELRRSARQSRSS